MKMDIQIPFIFISIFSLASVLLIFIYKFGIKEKSYEEALAEQRQQSNILLGVKPKLKEKKSKKPVKKGQLKEKTVEEQEVGTETEQTEPSQKNTETEKKPHVEFKEAPEDVPPKAANKKQTKKEKVRPILVHKNENEANSVNTDSASSQSNHFEELHPKDDFELFRSTSAERTVKEAEKKPESDPEPVQKKQEVEPVATQKTVPSVANGFVYNTGKDKKKKKSEFNTLQQLAGNGPNMSLLLDLVRKAELSRSEVQILIDLLLNKQHEAPAIIDEWSEGKSDPVQKLKKQLAEKEKLLSEEQQAVASAQSKLREIRSEYQNEKAGLLQKVRNMEEMMHSKQLEATRSHQQIQQLQAQIKDEAMKSHKLREEQAALQMQRQQIEMRLSQAQESDVIITQLQTEMQELSSMNNQLRMELAHFNEENIGEKERNKSLILQLNNFQNELEQKNERNRQLEETHVELQRKLESLLKQESDVTVEITRLNAAMQQQNEEIRKLEQYSEDLQKQKEESNKLVNQLTNDLRRVQEENAQLKVSHMNGSLQESKQHQVEILNLQNELSSMKTELTQTEKRSESELKAAQSLTEKLQREIEELKKEIDVEKLKVEEQKLKNNELRERNWKVMEALNAAEVRIKTASIKTKSEEEIQREFIQRLFPEIKDEEIADKVQGEKFIRKYIGDLRKNSNSETDQDTSQMKLQIQHYKNVIDSTEKMLNKLQKHIEEEEIKWRVQLAAKTAELESLKEGHRQELQQKLASLEIELNKEKEDKERLIAQFQHCNGDHAQSTASVH